MTSRRDFVRGSLVLSTFGGFTLRRASARPAPSATFRAAGVIAIADVAFTESAAFAAEAAHCGIDVRGFDGDVGALWLREIEPAVRLNRAALVGLTGPGVLFCLETMARAQGFGVVFRAERPPDGGRGWESVAARHALAAAADAGARGGAVLEPFEHVVRPSAGTPPLLAWTIARDARRPIPQ